MKTSKRAREARKKLAKDPAGKKGQEIWDGPGTTYVPRTGNVGRARHNLRPESGLQA